MGRGQALASILILLVLLLIALVYSGRIAVSDIRTSGAEAKAVQAFEAAEAGLQAAIGLLNAQQENYVKDDIDNTTASPNPDGWMDPNTITQQTTGDSSVFSFTSGTYSTWSASLSNIVNGDFSRLLITSRGCSDGCSPCDSSCKSTAVVSQVMGLRPLFPGHPDATLVAAGTVDLSGSVTVACQAATPHTCIHSGGITTLQKADMVDPLGSVIQNDAALAAMTPESLFEQFFGANSASVQGSANITCSNGTCPVSIDSPNGDGTLIWIDASSPFTINASLASQIGSPGNPVLMVVYNPGGNNFKLNGNTTFYGVIYVMGGWNNSGGGTTNIQGAVITDGNFSGSGTPDPTYNPGVIDHVRNRGVYLPAPGGWSDF